MSFPEDYIPTDTTSGAAVAEIKCRICEIPMSTTDEYRMHLIDSHYELLTNDELNGIVTVGGDI